MEIGDIKIYSDEGKPVRTIVAVTSARVEHYDDIVEYMVRAEVARCKEQDKFNPSKEQVEFLRKELVRYTVIRRDIETAQKLRIKKSNILCG